MSFESCGERWRCHRGVRLVGAPRDASESEKSVFGPQNAEDAGVWNTFMALASTTAHLEISNHASLKGRINQAGQIPALASVICVRALGLAVGASWDP